MKKITDVSETMFMAPRMVYCFTLELNVEEYERKVKEAIYIRPRAPTMNRDQGYHLPAIYNQFIPPKPEATHVTPVREQGP